LAESRVPSTMQILLMDPLPLLGAPRPWPSLPESGRDGTGRVESSRVESSRVVVRAGSSGRRCSDLLWLLPLSFVAGARCPLSTNAPSSSTLLPTLRQPWRRRRRRRRKCCSGAAPRWSSSGLLATSAMLAVSVGLNVRTLAAAAANDVAEQQPRRQRQQ
jgi:hypothetical protein